MLLTELGCPFWRFLEKPASLFCMEIIAVKLLNPCAEPNRSMAVRICRIDSGSPLFRMSGKGFFLSLILTGKFVTPKHL